MPYTSDAAVLAFADLAREQWRYLQARDPELCYDYVMGTDAAQASRALDLLSPALRDREGEVLVGVLRADIRRQQPMLSEAAWTDLMMTLLVRLRPQFGDADQAQANLSSPTLDKAKACAFSIALYGDLLRLPAKQAAPAERYLLTP